MGYFRTPRRIWFTSIDRLSKLQNPAFTGQLDDRRSDQFGQPGAAVRGLDTVGVVAEGAPNRKGAHSIGFQRQQKATSMASKRRRDASVLTARMRRMSGPAFGGVGGIQILKRGRPLAENRPNGAAKFPFFPENFHSRPAINVYVVHRTLRGFGKLSRP